MGFEYTFNDTQKIVTDIDVHIAVVVVKHPLKMSRITKQVTRKISTFLQAYIEVVCETIDFKDEFMDLALGMCVDQRGLTAK
jgi:hypothetical protein